MEWLQSLLDNSTTPALIAFLLGLLTAVSPCPLATNIAAIGYIGKEVENRFQERFAIYAWAHCRLYGIGMRVDYGSRRGCEPVWHSKGYREIRGNVVASGFIAHRIVYVVRKHSQSASVRI